MLGSAFVDGASLELISSGPLGTFDLSKGQTYKTCQKQKRLANQLNGARL